jgi:signal transduction histidine kinase
VNDAAEQDLRIGSKSAGSDTLLVVGAGYNEVTRLRAELQLGGYETLPALGTSEAVRLIASQPIQLAIVLSALDSSGTPGERSDAPSESSGTPRKDQEDFRLAAAVASVALANRISVLLISSIWNDSAVVGALRTGADYFLFAPYQSEDLLRAVHEALLNGCVAEPVADPPAEPAIEVLHQDRTYLVTAGRRQFAHLSLAATEQLRRSLATQAWLQAEIDDLRQQLRREREYSQISTQIPELVQGIGHDFGNLLETISAASTMLRADPSNEPYRDAMDAAIAQSATLLGALQSWGHLNHDGSHLEPVDLAAVAHEVLATALLPVRAPKIRVRLQMEGLPPVQTSRPLLIRALNNLVRNAVESMPSGGLLSLLAYPRRHRVTVEIRDTGPGIAEEDQEKIFSAGHTTKPGHLGLGLTLVRGLVEGAGGKISFASRPGRGTTFAFSLPVAERAVASHPAAGHPMAENEVAALPPARPSKKLKAG